MNIVWAVQSGDIAKIKDFLTLGVDVNASGTSNGSLLAYAGHWGRTETIELLLDSGARLNERDYNGWTPLMAAAARTQFEQPPPPDENAAAVRLLVLRGADINLRSKRGWTALMLAVERDSGKVEEILREAGSDATGIEQARFVRAALNNRIDEMRQSLSMGASIDAPNEPLGWTALGWAAARGDTTAVRALLNAGAKVDQADENGITPLWHVATVEEWAYDE